MKLNIPPKKMNPAKLPKAPPPLTTEDLKGLAEDTVASQKDCLLPEDYEVYIRALFDVCTDHMAAINTHETKSQRREEVSEIDAEAIVTQLHTGDSQLEHLSRIELVAVALHLGAADVDTRGKPVKQLRELVKTKMAEEPAEPVKPRPPARLPGAKPTNGTSTLKFKIPRRAAS